MNTSSFEVHRAVVQFSDTETGLAKVRVPALLGADPVVAMPTVGLTQTDGVWNVPPAGTALFIAVSQDRTIFHWLTALDTIGYEEYEPALAEIVAATGEPMGHSDRTDSAMSFNDSTRTFTIQPVEDSYEVWCVGKKYTKTTAESVTIPDATDLYYIYFDTEGALQYRTTYFVWDQDCPTSYVYWNSTTQKAEFFADERHGIVLDWQTHEYLHRTRGASIANGFNLDPTSFIIDGNGTADSHCYFTLENGTFFDEDLQVDVVSTATPSANSWEQDLSSPAQIPVFYLTANGWVRDDPTNFPFKMGASHPYFNDGTSLTQIDTNKFGIAWIVATNNLNYPVLAIMGQAQYLNIGDAEAADWSELDLTDLPIVEMRPLYKYVFQTKDTYTNSVKAALRGLYDIRRSEVAVQISPMVSVDHGGLLGLADDDHPQYYNEARLTTALSDITDDLSSLEARIRINSASRIQLGTDFTGSATGDFLGISTSLSDDGSRVAIGASGSNSAAGSVTIYDWNGSTWSQVGSSIVGGTAGDNSGQSISLSSDGTRIAIGSTQSNSVAGHVSVYAYSGGSWSQLGSDIVGESADDEFGKSVALSSDGSRLVASGPYNDGSGTNAGHVRVYDWDGSAWTQVGADIEGEAANDQMGAGSVAISSDGAYVAVGAHLNDGTGSNAGHTRVFNWNGSAWSQLGSDIEGEAAGDYAGYAVSLSSSGLRVAIGAYLNDGTATDAGHVRVYDWDGSTWNQVGDDIDGLVTQDTIGSAVSISSDGNRLVAGGFFAGTATGVVKVYDWSGTSWVQITGDISGTTSSYFGYSVAISGDGRTIAAGAPYANSYYGFAEVHRITSYVDPV